MQRKLPLSGSNSGSNSGSKSTNLTHSFDLSFVELNHKNVVAASDLLREAWHDSYQCILEARHIDELWQKTSSPQQLIALKSNENIKTIVAKKHDKVIGVLQFQEPISNFVWISQLYLKQTVLRQGLGTYFLNYILKNEHRIDYLMCDVVKSNHTARHFYEQNGFQAVGERQIELAALRLDVQLLGIYAKTLRERLNVRLSA